MSDYPEHDKLREVADTSQAIYDFVEWCGDEHRLHLMREDGTEKHIRDLLAEHFGIDMAKIETEKRAMLAALRADA